MKENPGKFTKCKQVLLTQELIVDGLGLDQAHFKAILKKADALGVPIGLLLRQFLSLGNKLLGCVEILLQPLILLEESKIFIAEVLDVSSLRKSPLRLSKSTC